MNGYAICFDMYIDLLEKYYGTPYNNAYIEIRSVMLDCGFEWVQGSTFVTKGNLVNLTKAISDLKSIEWFSKSVRDIRAFKVEEWSNFTSYFKENNPLPSSKKKNRK